MIIRGGSLRRGLARLAVVAMLVTTAWPGGVEAHAGTTNAQRTGGLPSAAGAALAGEDDRGSSIPSMGPADAPTAALSVPTVQVVAAGDIARCSSSGDEATAALLTTINGDVLALGDTVYESGTPSEYTNCYDPSWGAAKARTRPVVGNHEYGTANASGYFGYFGAAAHGPNGYYSYDYGAWHIIVLNSMCANVGGCDAGSPQLAWLVADLAASDADCTMALWHHPLVSSNRGVNTGIQPLFQALYDANADLVLTGHDHDYERFAPQTPTRILDNNRGIRQFVVGTGGRNHDSFGTVQPNSEVRNADAFGVIKLQLHPTSFDWEFVPEAGRTFTDSGSDECHDANGPIATGSNQPPVFSTDLPDRNDAVGAPVSIDADATDPDGDTIAYSATGLPGGIAIDAGSGVISGTLNPGTSGTYSVAVIASDGTATDTDTFTWTVAAAGQTTYASDTFSRTVVNNWGSATPTGGAYTLLGTAADFDVNGSVGTINMAAGATRTASLGSVSAQDVELSFRFTSDKTPAGGSLYLYGIVRRVSATASYRVKVRIAPNGQVFVHASQLVSNTETPIGSEVLVPGLTYTPGAFIRVRAQVQGSGSTTLRVRAWAATGSEPSTWQYTGTNTVAALQVAGGAGLMAYLNGSTTNSPILVTLDDFLVTSIP